MLIYREHVVFLILKQHVPYVYCFTCRQADLIVTRSKAFSDCTLFVSLQRLSFNFPSIFLYAYILAPNGTNSIMIFPTSSCLIISVTFLFFLLVVACYHALYTVCIKFCIWIFCYVLVPMFCL